MNISEKTVGNKLVFPKYKFNEFPMELYGAAGTSKKVNSQAEYEAAVASGYSENPPAITNVAPVASMTTAPAIQASYDALKKLFDGTVIEFNTKYAALKDKYDALLKEHEQVALFANMKD